MLNAEQQRAFEKVKAGTSILLSGSAGTGKSFTLTHIIEWAKIQNKNIGVTGTTGTSALLIGGRTIHSFLGIGLANKPSKQLANSILYNKKKILDRIRKLDILIIDEISLLDDVLFEKISDLLSILRLETEKPFGGVQVIFCGDFSQNCPINGKYCFLSETWKHMNIEKVFLQQLIRQQDDTEFQTILEALRFGKVTSAMIKQLEKLKDTKFDEGVEPTILYGKNIDVDKVNNNNFKKLVDSGAVVKTYVPTYSNENAKAWGQSCKVNDSLELCIGSQVVLTWNVSVDNGLVNGSRGVITGFKPNNLPIIKFYNIHDNDVVIEEISIKNEDDPLNMITFLPIKLAWAMTISKSQGCTLDYCIIDLNSWACGQSYTALSRVRSLKHVKLIGEIKQSYFKVSPDVIEFYLK